MPAWSPPERIHFFTRSPSCYAEPPSPSSAPSSPPPRAPAAAQDGKTLNFGIISTESSSNQKQVWQPVIDDLSRAIGVPVKPFFASDYAGIIEGMRFNKVQMAWYGNKSAIEAVDRANGEVFASVIDRTATRATGRC